MFLDVHLFIDGVTSRREVPSVWARHFFPSQERAVRPDGPPTRRRRTLRILGRVRRDTRVGSDRGLSVKRPVVTDRQVLVLQPPRADRRGSLGLRLGRDSVGPVNRPGRVVGKASRGWYHPRPPWISWLSSTVLNLNRAFR